MEIKQLQYFIAIVEEGTISGAARRMHISQPPLSNMIKQLEGEIGTVLFKRGYRNIMLTEAGKLLYKNSKIIVDLSENTIAEIQDKSVGVKGTLKLGVVSSAGYIFLNLIVDKFKKQYPDLKFELTEANTYHLLDMLNSKSMECAIIRTPFPSLEYEAYEIECERMVAIGDKKYFENFNEDGNSITVAELIDSPIIVYRRWYHIIRDEMKKYDKIAHIVCVNDDARTTVAWAKKGMGIGIVPESGIQDINLNSVTVKYIKDTNLLSHIVCVFAGDGYRGDTTTLLYNFIRSNFRKYEY